MSITLQQFVTYAVVAAGAGTTISLAKALNALKDFVGGFPDSERRSALCAARQGLESVNLRGTVADRLLHEIDDQIAQYAERTPTVGKF